MLGVELIGERCLGVIVIRQDFLGGQRRLLAAPTLVVERGVAADEDQPCGGVARWAFYRPGLQCTQGGFLEGFFGGVEVPEIAQQRRHGLRAGGSEGGVDPAKVSHRESLAYCQGRAT